jgi:hypothetical protein
MSSDAFFFFLESLDAFNESFQLIFGKAGGWLFFFSRAVAGIDVSDYAGG